MFNIIIKRCPNTMHNIGKPQCVNKSAGTPVYCHTAAVPRPLVDPGSEEPRVVHEINKWSADNV